MMESILNTLNMDFFYLLMPSRLFKIVSSSLRESKFLKKGFFNL